MPSPERLKRVLRKLKGLNCSWRRTGNNYFHLEREVEGRIKTANFPTVKGRQVKAVYVGQIKTQLLISDDEWDAA